MTTAADITALQAATAQAVKDLNGMVALQAQLTAAQADLLVANKKVADQVLMITTLTADKAALAASNATLATQIVGLQGQVSDLTTRLAGATDSINSLTAQNAALSATNQSLAPDAARWQRARVPDPTTYDQFFKDGGITSVALSGADADAAMDLDIAGKTPAGTFLGMYSMSVVKP